MEYVPRPFAIITETLLNEELQRVSAAYQPLDVVNHVLSGLAIDAIMVTPKASGSGGIKVDVDAPTWGWRDLEGPLIPKATGVGTPALATYRGTIRDFNYGVNDIVDMKFHMPHDWVEGSDLYIHLHWSHNGTNVSGTLQAVYRLMFAKGHNQEAFPAESSLAHTVLSLSAGIAPQYMHRIEEIQLSAASPSGGQLDTDSLEVDGIIMMSLRMAKIPSITGGSGKPFLHYADIHYQSSNVGTKQKAPDFYT